MASILVDYENVSATGGLKGGVGCRGNYRRICDSSNRVVIAKNATTTKQIGKHTL